MDIEMSQVRKFMEKGLAKLRARLPSGTLKYPWGQPASFEALCDLAWGSEMSLPFVQAALAAAGSGTSKGRLEIHRAFLRFELDLKSSREEETAWSGSKTTGCALNLQLGLGLLSIWVL